ncbi:MAG: hypothetical protein BroJett018_47680 [Chloroflexota bacterium]|nr:hypothetical protein [Chloroflexota bacterium]NOG65810.1 hypothetical protein [Chloroflexota bacterium]GIK66974.1 MAG: hypothetical protein BroJett018_47680 [Chloroflexota bacterium]
MTVRFHVTPYNPMLWMDENNVPSEPPSDLHIKFSEFRERLTEFGEMIREVNWDIKTHSDAGWEVTADSNWGVSGSFGGHLNQILTMEAGLGLNEFVAWYRSFVPSEHALYLFQEGEWESLELREGITVEEIANFTGIT